MKTVVLGLFDDLAQARGVLTQLVGSPLDMDAIEVVNNDLDVQRALVADHGLDRGRRGVGTAVGLCAMLGAVGGYLLGTGPLADLGALLTVAGGILLGAAGGLALGLLSETVRVPEEHSAAVLSALGEGATAIVVRTSNLPTAHAIGDLFRAGGSRLLDAPVAKRRAPAGGIPESGAGDRSESAESTPERPSAAGGSAPSPAGAEDTPAAETLFAPPWRRGADGTGGTDSDSVPAPEASESDTAFSAPSAAAPPAVARFRAPSVAETPPLSTAPALSDEADIVALDLTPRFARPLREAGLVTVGALKASFGRDGEALKAIAGIGPAAIAEIEERLVTLAGFRPGAPAQTGADDER